MLTLRDKRIAPKALMRLHLHFTITSPLTEADDVEGGIFGNPAITEAPAIVSGSPADAGFTRSHYSSPSSSSS
jgi:hypothetical protein